MNLGYYEIHRHDEFSAFDGFGNAEQAAKYASELNHKALGLTNHGNITGLIKHYKACEKYDIIPIMGIEAYFQPKINKDKPAYHLCLFATNMEGWENLNQLVTESNKEENFFKTGRISFEMLEQYSEGVACSSACISGYIPRMIEKGKTELAEKAAQKFKSIFQDRFFFEIMPIELGGEDQRKGKRNMQIIVNNELMRIGLKQSIPVICTSDSHYIRKGDFATYLKMHEMKSSNYGNHYQERYMHDKKEMQQKILRYHTDDQLRQIHNGMGEFLAVIGDAREWFHFDEKMVRYTKNPDKSYCLMKRQCIARLKELGKFDEEYQRRLKYEFDVIKHHGFQDYFMIVQDYVNWAKDHDIPVGPGRGSAGNSLVNYALNITKIDAVKFGNEFDRFLRKDKKKFPDIDVDFCRDRRDEVIEYITTKYGGKAAQTVTYSRYNVKNLLNDLFKVCGVDSASDKEEIKRLLSKYCQDNNHVIDEEMYNDRHLREYDLLYDNIITHFSKMYGKVRHFGTHASAVILSNDEISKQVGILRVGGKYRTSFDLKDIEYLGLLKLDILGLASATLVHELEKITGEEWNDEMLEDEEMLKGFERGNAAVFQFESKTANSIAQTIGIDSFEDIVVATSINRPGPLSMRIHEQYRDAKINPRTTDPWYKYAKETYGTIIYQEQGMKICREIGKMNPDDTDKLVKADINHITPEQMEKWRTDFTRGASSFGLNASQIDQLFNSLINYSFNRGHGVAYGSIAAELMYFKVHYPIYFWYCTLKYEPSKEKLPRLESLASKDGCIIFLPHVNGSANYSIGEFEGEEIIYKGLSTIKDVGDVASHRIEQERLQHGDYKSKTDFRERLESRAVTSRAYEALLQAGALEFNTNKLMNRNEQYNMAINSRGY